MWRGISSRLLTAQLWLHFLLVESQNSEHKAGINFSLFRHSLITCLHLKGKKLCVGVCVCVFVSVCVCNQSWVKRLNCILGSSPGVPLNTLLYLSKLHKKIGENYNYKLKIIRMKSSPLITYFSHQLKQKNKNITFKKSISCVHIVWSQLVLLLFLKI